MTRALRLACILGALLAVASGDVVRAAEETPRQRSITVVGVGRERGAPDVVDLRVAVEQTAPTAKAAGQAAAKAATQVIEALRGDVGTGGRVETAGFSLNPVYRSDERGVRKPEIVAYTAVNEVAAHSRRLDAVGALIDAAIAAGAARVSSLSFTIEDPTEVQGRALRAAGADAASQAAAIADALHLKLKGVIEASTEMPGRPIPVHLEGIARSASQAMSETPIEPGQVSTEAHLRVVYALE